MMGVGPFSIQAVIIFAAILLAWLAARVAARGLPDGAHKRAGAMVLDAVMWGLVAARLGYIAQWWEEYSAAPRAMIAIGDGGFSWRVGLLAALAYVGWRSRPAPLLRGPVLTGLVVGGMAWVAAQGVLEHLRQSAAPLPDLQLMALDGRPLALQTYAGRPIVLNLWASWCPPCRREMPVFEQAQEEFPHIAFVMINQGESAAQARRFLTSEGLVLRDVLLDPASSAMRELRSSGLPTTLFFDADGALVHSHMGELTMASLKSTILRRFAPAAPASAAP
ncbi:MAG: TlpA family protein disulfide reductase [Pigmentiphaga sp.]|nr:TlpA family protein disulfide reductase [Pigmentiphaga sp.]